MSLDSPTEIAESPKVKKPFYSLKDITNAAAAIIDTIPEATLKVLPQLKTQRYKSVKRPPWNERFYIDGLTNFTEAHPYFKVYLYTHS